MIFFNSLIDLLRNFVLFLIFIFVIQRCGYVNKSSITILEDVTEPDFLSRPHAEAIFENYGFDKDLFAQANFRYSTISSLEHNPEHNLSLDGSGPFFANELDRRVAVKGFQRAIERIIPSVPPSQGHEYSSIWKPIVREIILLQQQEGLKQLFIFSDLQENSKFFSIHQYSDFNRLVNQERQVMQQFLELAHQIERSDSLLNVTVVHQPKTMENDEQYNRMKALYQLIFRELDIDITFKTQHYESSSKSALENPE